MNPLTQPSSRSDARFGSWPCERGAAHRRPERRLGLVEAIGHPAGGAVHRRAALFVWRLRAYPMAIAPQFAENRKFRHILVLGGAISKPSTSLSEIRPIRSREHGFLSGEVMRVWRAFGADIFHPFT